MNGTKGEKEPIARARNISFCADFDFFPKILLGNAMLAKAALT